MSARGARSTRGHNLATVVQALHRQPASRAELAGRTGLTKATVSALVADLVDAGLVDEEPARVPARTPVRAGRPAIGLHLSGRRLAAVGLELTPAGSRAAVVDLTGAVRHEEVLDAPTPSDPTAAAAALAGLADRAVAAARRARLDVAGTVLAVPGLVDEPGEVVLSSPNLRWHDVSLSALVARHRAAPTEAVRIDNEANLAALAHVGRVAPEDADVVVVSAGVGVGAGVVLGGHLFRGAHGFGGELGHLVVDPDGARCRCGSRGCLETVVGLHAVLRAAGLRRTPDPAVAVGRLASRVAAGEPRAVAALDAVREALAQGLAAVVHLFDPDRVVLAGWPVAVADRLVPELEDRLARRVLGARVAGVSLVPSPLGDRAAVHGAARAALDEVLADPLAWITRR